MKFKKILLITLVLLSLLMIGAVSAANDAEDLASSNSTSDMIAHAGNVDGIKISTVDNTLNEEETLEGDEGSNDLLQANNKIIKITDDNYKDYFDENGSILENGKIIDGDKLVLENINNKTFIITKTLNVTSNFNYLNNVSLIFNNGSDNSIVENLIIYNYGDLTAIKVNNADFVSILSSRIHVESLESNGDVMAIYANSTNYLYVKESFIRFIGKTNGVGVNNAVRIVDSKDAYFMQNDLDIKISGADINATSGFGASEGFALDGCYRVSLENNTISLVSDESLGSCPTVYVIHSERSQEVSISDNFIEASGSVYHFYGIKVGGDGFYVSKNNIEIINDKSYARGIEISPNSSGFISNNYIYINSLELAQGIYAAFDKITLNGSAVLYENNDIEGYARIVYAMEIFGPSSFEKNKVLACGDYAVGIASKTDSGNISLFKHNTVNVTGLKDGACEVEGNIFPAVTVGIYTIGNSQMQYNIISSTGNQTIFVSATEANITDNYLVSTKFLGDESVLDVNGVNITGNVPMVGATNYDVNGENYVLFFNGPGLLRSYITPESLTFHDVFCGLELNNDIFVIDRPIRLLSDNATMDTAGFDIISDNVVLDGFNFMGNAFNRIYVSDVENVSIINNNFLLDDVIPGEDAGGFNVVVKIIDSDGVLIDNNRIVLNVTSNDPLYNRVIWAQDSGHVVISNNTIFALIPSIPVDWSTGDVYSEGVYLQDCDNVILAKNTIEVASAFHKSDYDSIYAVYITGKNATVYENLIGVVGAPDGHGLVLAVENFTVFANIIHTGINFTALLNSSSASLFSAENYFNIKNVTEYYEKIVNYANTIKSHMNDMNPDIFTATAYAVDIDSNSKGIIEFNLIGAVAISPYGIRATDWPGDVQIESAFNLILGLGNSAFGMSLSGSEALVKYSLIAMFANFTTGIASSADNINITHVAIESLGSNEGTHLGSDEMGIETTGIHIVKGNAIITGNIVNTTGEYAVDFEGEGSVVENYLVANVYTGDASVNYVPGHATVKDNAPKMQIKIHANDIAAFWDEDIICRVNVTDYNGRAPLSNVIVQLTVGKNNYTNKTDKNGVAIFNLGKFNVGSYNLIITTHDNSSYVPANETVTVTVNKLKAKMTADEKTFKDTDKIKKYTIALKDNKGRAIKYASVILIVNGKSYYATTNYKGLATFKLKKLTKVGKYKAVITYKKNKHYTKITKKVKITVKSTFKTIGKGSNDYKMVKKIQRALKNNGYYLSYKGHYLMVDGIFGIYTKLAVKEFQAAKGLKVTGKVDYNTAKKLKLI